MIQKIQLFIIKRLKLDRKEEFFMKWNPAQHQAIHERRKEILVSAGAGSGKTAVLIERIMQKILTENRNVDEILIVTFTNLAAKEMKERLRIRLEEALADSPLEKHLQDQIYKIPYANISTFHTFCNELARRYYYLLDLDANITLIDDAQVALMKDEVLEAQFERFHDEQNPDFLLLEASFGTDRDDESLKIMLLKMYEMARANPNMDDWLDGLTDLYDMPTSDLSTWIHYPKFTEFIELLTDEAKNHLQKARAAALQAPLVEKTHPYLDGVYESDLALLKQLIVNIDTYGAAREFLYSMSLERFPTAKKAEFDEMLHKEVSESRKRFKTIIEGIKKDFFAYTNETHRIHFEHCQRVMKSLVSVIRLYHKALMTHKKAQNKLDFSDLEWFAWELLSKPEIAQEVATQFKEIMIDEYQDTNDMQETIIGLMRQMVTVPLFMVGDVKQSIYRFRQAEPSIFRNKYQRYQGTINGAASSVLKIDLMENYRSSKEVIDATNSVFERLMDEAVAEIKYDEDARLKLGVTGEETGDFNQAELHLIDREEILTNTSVNEQSANEIEARHVAGLVHDYVTNGHEIYDRKLGKKRQVQYGDIVILMRSLTHVSIYQDVFTKYGIPLFTESPGDLLQATEVINILSLLKVIDNPYQDIELVGVMRSPLFFFTDSDLATIKTSAGGSNFYECAQNYAKIGTNERLKSKTGDFLGKVNRWRYQSKTQSIWNLLQDIYISTAYYDFVLSRPHATLRKANLDLFQKIARDYEESSKKGLYDFLNYIENLQILGRTIPRAKVSTAESDVVRVMTIHKSKGLEFPIVIMSQIQKQFNIADETGNYVMHKNYGVALKYIDPELRLKQKTMATVLLAKLIRKEMLAEEMRLLYVAMTRAKSKLIFTGTFDTKKRQEAITETTDILLPQYDRQNAKSYADWLLPAILPESETKMDSIWQVRLVTELCDVLEVEKSPANVSEVPLEIDLHQVLHKTYRHQELTGILAKQSVSQRKIEEEVPLIKGVPEVMEAVAYDRPSFMRKDFTPAEIGTALHQFMQHLDVRRDWTLATLQELQLELVNRNIIKQAVASKIDLSDVLKYTQSAVFSRLKYAIQVKKELPFMSLVQVGESEASRTLLQGVIDLLVEFEEEVWVVDYKTDFVKNFERESEELHRRYDIQMKYYLQAIGDIYKDKKISCHVYFMRAGKAIVYEKLTTK